MLYTSRTFRLLLVLFLPALLGSCTIDDSPLPEPVPITSGIYVLNEGLFNQNNSSLTYYDLSSEIAHDHYFQDLNGRSLGDGGNDLKAYGSKLYAVMNGSSQVEVIDLNTGMSVKQVPVFDENEQPRSPRKIAFYGKYAYVCSFDGTVGRLDTTSLEFDAFISAGRQPDGICVAGDNLYVSNSGGLDYPDYDSTVSVISTAGFVESKKITVGLNPGSIQADDQGNIYVITRGNYDDIAPAIKRIDATSEEVTILQGVQAAGISIQNQSMYLYNYDYSTGETVIKILDSVSGEIQNSNFLQSSPDIISTPYSIAVDPVNDDVYLSDALDYTTTGNVYCFDSNGQPKFNFEAGLNPNNIVFIRN